MKTLLAFKKLAVTASTRVAQHKILYSAVAAILLFFFPSFLNAQYVRSYQATQQANLTFNCISRSLTGTYYIAGMVDTSVYVAEVDGAGNMIREKLIGVGNKDYNLNAMVTDADGNIVIVGAINIGLTNTRSFLMKISPMLSLILHRTYDDITQKGSALIFTDVKDFTGNASLDAYYISGGTRNANNNTRADVLLVAVDRNTGNIIKIYSGNRGEDNYDALVIAPRLTRPPTMSLFATGRLSTGGPATFRPWINAHNSNLGFTGLGAQYLQPTTTPARLYSSSLIIEGAFTRNPALTYCWYGDLNSTSFGLNIGMGSFNATTLNPNWQREYVITPAAASFILLNKVAADAGGYVAEGNWWDGSTTTTDGAYAGEMFLLRTDKSGIPIWSRRLDKVFVNQRTHNSGMLIDNYNGRDMIFAVGFKTGNSGLTEGVLVQMPFTGAMDTVCAPVQNTLVKTRDYSIQQTIDSLAIKTQGAINYFPVNCIQTINERKCDTTCDSIKVNAGFDLSGLMVNGNNTTFQVTASNFATTPNAQWIVSDVNLANNNDIPGTVQASAINGFWASSASTSFGGYYSSIGAENAGMGVFLQQHKYRFRHIITAANNCGIATSDTVTKVIYMGNSFRSGSKSNFIVVDETGAKQDAKTGSPSALTTSKTSLAGKTVIYPNPANQTINLNVENLGISNPVVQIFAANGQLMETIKLAGKQQNIKVANWSAGSYNYNILMGGKIIDAGKFMVQH